MERLVAAAWRLRRALAIEQGVLKAESDNKRTDVGMAFWRDAQKGDALGKLRRCSLAAENSFHSALHELQRLHAARSGQQVALPAAVDINLNVGGETAIEGQSVGAADPG